MNRAIILLGLALAITAPGTAFALNMEYYTYNGFDTVVPAFQRLALIFSDNNYLTLFISFAILGIVIGGSLVYMKGLSGQQVSLQSWAIPILIGLALFKGLLLPKGEITVFDPVRNEFQVVADVPDAIVAVAGILNLIERSVQDVVDTAAAYPYEDEAGGITFDLLLKATSSTLEIDDFFLTKTVGKYFVDCSPVALNSPAYPVSEQSLKRGNDDLRSELSNMAVPTIYTTVYNAANKWGVTNTCEDAWNLSINPLLNDAAFANLEASVCAKVGYKVGSVPQLNKCRERMQVAMEQYGVPNGTFASIHFIRNIFLAQSIDKAMQDNNPDLSTQGLANRDLMVQGVGVASAANMWLPQLRAIMTAVALGIVPLLALFVVTPLVGKAVLFTVTLFGWITLWGVTDIVMHQMAMDGAIAFYERHSTLGFGLDSIYMSPDASSQAVALFGKIRTYSIMIASVIAMALWKFGGYAMAQMSENMGQHIERAGEQAAMQTQTPEGRAHKMSELSSAMGTEAMRAHHSLESQALHGLHTASSATTGTQTLMNKAAEAGMSVNDVMATTGKMSGSRDHERIESLRGVAENLGRNSNDPNVIGDLAGDLENIRSTMFAGNTLAAREAIETFGGGDFTQGALNMAGIDAFSKFGNTAEIGRVTDYMKSHVQEKHGITPSDGKIYQTIAGMNNSDLWANMKATGAESDELIDLMSKNKGMSLSQMDTLFDTGQSLGMSPKEMGRVLGEFNAAENFAKATTEEQIGFDGMYLGYYANNLRHGHHGLAVEAVAEESGKSMSEFIGNMEEIGAHRELGTFMSMDWAARTLDRNVGDIALMQQGTNNSLTMSGTDSVEKFISAMEPHDVLDRTQESFLRRHAEEEGGLTFNYSFDPTDPNGKPIHTSMKAGSEIYVNNSSRADMTEAVSAGSTISKEGVHAMLDNSLPGSASNSMWKEAGSHFVADWQGAVGQNEVFDGQFTRSFFDELSAVYSTYGAATASSSDTERMSHQESAYAGVKTSGIFGFLDAGARVSVSNEGATQDSEQISYPLPTYMMAAGLTDAMKMADETLVGRGYSLDSQNQSDIDDMNDLRADVIRDKMMNLHGSYMSYLQGRGEDEFKDSDVYEDLYEKWKGSDGSYVGNDEGLIDKMKSWK